MSRLAQGYIEAEAKRWRGTRCVLPTVIAMLGHLPMQNEPSQLLAKLRVQQKQLTERIRQLETRAKMKSRKLETRRKVLLGALLSQWMQDDVIMTKRVQAALPTFLVRQVDRDVFGLKPPKTDAAKVASTSTR
ncbi:MAG: hypothetical protein EOO38_13015 [Cytophagaceae bacterium]|nr:MAG: hypothetical protein EOO38_13015 [Cytophagaceae bacterium]